MTKSLLAIFGATGNQGNSTAYAVLDNAELFQRYSVRAISRDVSTPKMQELKSKGAELLQANLDDTSSLPAALNGVEYVFFMTATQYQGHTREIETRQAKAVCTEAVKQGVKYIIFSSMSHPSKMSDGKLNSVEHFDVKAELEQYIRSLPVKSAFYAPGSFMQNLESQMRPRPSPANDGTYILASILRADTVYPWIDITDTGKWIGAILADPQKYEGKFLAASAQMLTLAETCAVMSKATGKTVTYQQMPDEKIKGFLPEAMREQLYEMYVWCREYGYFGPDMKEQVEWSQKQARGKLTSLEEFLKRVNYKLE